MAMPAFMVLLLDEVIQQREVTKSEDVLEQFLDGDDLNCGGRACCLVEIYQMLLGCEAENGRGVLC